MLLNNKPLDQITVHDLQALINNQVPESKTIEYKEALPGNAYASKKEFLADVSSLANASGGYLIYGMRAQAGIPTELSGLGNINADNEILRLDNMLQHGIEPRIPGIAIRPVTLEPGGVALIMSIPRSWAAPHVVKLEGHWRFYSRNSAGKYPLDVAEVRSAFVLSETLGERIRNFRIERLGKVVAAETPIPLVEGAKSVFHIIPFSAFEPGVVFDSTTLLTIVASLSI